MFKRSCTYQTIPCQTSELLSKAQFLLDLMRLSFDYDGLDGVNLASVEMIVRRLIQIETAVRRNPKSPDFTGLESLLEATEDETGGAVLPDFFTWLSSQQKDQAQILKQFRFFKEEQVSAAKTKTAQGGGKD